MKLSAHVFCQICSVCTNKILGSYIGAKQRAESYDDVIMEATTSQITGISIVYSAVFQAQMTENIKAPRHWRLWWEFTGEFPSQRASNTENVSIWKRHHGKHQNNPCLSA